MKFREKHGYICFQPCVDGYFLLGDPSETVVKGGHKKIPYLLGCTSGEQRGIPEDLEQFENNVRVNYPDIADRLLAAANVRSVEEMRALHCSDVFHTGYLANILFCKTQLNQGRLPAYLYFFDPTTVPGDDAGAFHSSDLWFMFETLAKSSRPFIGKHYDLARKMCNYWTNFIKCGDPNGNDADGAAMCKWTPFTEDFPGHLRFNEDIIEMRPAESALAKIMYQKYLG